MPETIKLGVVTHDTEVSYVNLYKHLENIDLVNEEHFRKVFDDIQFEEEVGYEYNSLPIYVGWAYIPIITEGLVEVKILKVEQGNSIAIILPEHVATNYKKLEDDITALDDINKTIDLVGDVYGFDDTDQELIELIKKLYITVGGDLDAFKLTTVGEEQYIEEEPEGENKEELGLGISNRPPAAMDDNVSFADLGDTELPEITANEESYKRFTKSTNVLKEYLRKLYVATPPAIREHISTKLIADEAILVVRVGNKEIYETFNTIPKHARNQITLIGESIRLNEGTQLVDSFKHNGGRVFVLAEKSHDNIWVVKGEEIQAVNTSKDKKLYISKKDAIIELERSDVRQESRKFVPRNQDGQTVFSVK